MKRGNCFFAALFLIINSVFFAGCGTQNGTKAESLNTEIPASSDTKNAKPRSTNEPGAQNRQTLWDFKKQTTEEPQKFSAAETKAVLRYLFGEQFNPEIQITNRVSGSFTKPDANETLYFITGCKDEQTGSFTSDCPHVSWNTDGWIAIYDGTTPVMKINEALGGEIVKVTDVNGDGISEILNYSGYAGSGIETIYANLGQVSGNKYQAIKTFKGYFSDCAEADANDGKHADRASTISYIPSAKGKTPVFTEEFFEAKCQDENSKGSPVWKKITQKEFDSFFDANS